MIGTMSIAQLRRDLMPRLTTTARGESCSFTRVCTDSREIQAGDFFVALRGSRFDGHQYLAQAHSAGAIGALVDTIVPSCPLAQLQVDNTLLGLGEIARLNRERFTKPLVAITGSSGKTSVRTMVDGILRCQGAVLSTQGNFNNHIGVPLTLLRLEGHEKYAVIEMGASAIGEIAYLCELAQPDVALINNVMPAHLEGFGSLEGVAEAKGEIYQGVSDKGCCVVNLDDQFAPVWLSQLHGRTSIGFSLTDTGADCYASELDSDGLSTSFNLHLRDRVLAVKLQASGLHNVRNALAAACCAHAVGASDESICAGLNAFTPVSGRMSTKPAMAGVRVIDDSYNANPGSVRAAIDVLSEIAGHTVLAMGDMGELGDDALRLHAEIGLYASQKNIQTVLSYGALAQAVSGNFCGANQHFNKQSDLIAHLQKMAQETDYTVLIKGSRSSHMDTVVAALTDGEAQ